MRRWNLHPVTILLPSQGTKPRIPAVTKLLLFRDNSDTFFLSGAVTIGIRLNIRGVLIKKIIPVMNQLCPNAAP
jgi:hypothetical protein